MFHHDRKWRRAWRLVCSVQLCQMRWAGVAGFAEHMFEIDTIEPARHENPRTGGLGVAPGLQPAPEVIGIVGKGAHATRRDIDRVVTLTGGIGDALLELAVCSTRGATPSACHWVTVIFSRSGRSAHATTLLGHVSVQLTRVAPDGFELLVLRSFARDVWDSLIATAREYGVTAETPAA